MTTITKTQAIALAESRAWEGMTYRERAEFQLEVKLMCMPFDVFHEALTKALGRPVWTHELGTNWQGLLAELRGEAPAPTVEEIMDLIPAERRILVEL